MSNQLKAGEVHRDQISCSSAACNRSHDHVKKSFPCRNAFPVPVFILDPCALHHLAFYYLNSSLFFFFKITSLPCKPEGKHELPKSEEKPLPSKQEQDIDKLVSQAGK